MKLNVINETNATTDFKDVFIFNTYFFSARLSAPKTRQLNNWCHSFRSLSSSQNMKMWKGARRKIYFGKSGINHTTDLLSVYLDSTVVRCKSNIAVKNKLYSNKGMHVTKDILTGIVWLCCNEITYNCARWHIFLFKIPKYFVNIYYFSILTYAGYVIMSIKNNTRLSKRTKAMWTYNKPLVILV